MPKMLIPTRRSDSFLLPCAPEAQSDLALFTALLGRMHSLVWSAAAICSTIRRFKKLKSPDCEKPSFFFHQKDDIAFVCLHGEKFGSEHVVCQIEFYIYTKRKMHPSLSSLSLVVVACGQWKADALRSNLSLLFVRIDSKCKARLFSLISL